MKKLIIIFTVILFAGNIQAKKTTVISYVSEILYIDGYIDECWSHATSEEKINVFYQSEVPTIGNSVWQGLYDVNYFYCYVFVNDDNHWPAWKSGGNNLEYDKPEFYLDVNEVLDDGVGASKLNSGHYQLADGFTEGSYDTEITKLPAFFGSNNPGGTYAYSLIDEGYVYEIAIPWNNLPDINGKIINDKLGGRSIGFDITIIDQDDGITTSRQRANWNNTGAIDECWNNMDGAGVIRLCYADPDFGWHHVAIPTVKTPSLNITPNPVCDHFTIMGDVGSVEIYNILGKLVSRSPVKNNRVDISSLPNGSYMVKAFSNNHFLGNGKIIKN
jgi:hypothetical protein